MFRRMARGLDDLEKHILDLDGVPFGHRDVVKLALGGSRRIDPGSGPLGQVHVSRNKIGVKMGL